MNHVYDDDVIYGSWELSYTNTCGFECAFQMYIYISGQGQTADAVTSVDHYTIFSG